MASAEDPERVVIHYFVDEAGNPTLFDAKGRILIGTEGCSSYLMLGKLDIDDPATLGRELDDLRARAVGRSVFQECPRHAAKDLMEGNGAKG